MFSSNGVKNCIFERTPREPREFRENKAVKNAIKSVFG